MIKERSASKLLASQCYPAVWQKIISGVYNSQEINQETESPIIKYLVTGIDGKHFIKTKTGYTNGDCKKTEEILLYHNGPEAQRLMVCRLSGEKLSECPQILVKYHKKGLFAGLNTISRINLVNKCFVDDFDVDNPQVIAVLMSQVLLRLDIDKDVWPIINRGSIGALEASGFYSKNFTG